MEFIVDCLADLINIPSVSGDERGICDFVEKRVQQSVSNSVLRIDNSLIASIDSRSSSPSVGLFGHLDTVPGGWEPKNAVIKDDKIIGLGASDMKGGLAVMLALLEEFTGEKPPCNLVFVFYEGEEGANETNGIHKILKAPGPHQNLDFAFVLEPTDNELHLGCVGSIRARVSFRGQRAHSARPWTGENAIHKVGPLLHRLADFKPKPVFSGGLEFLEVMSATMIHGGSAVNVIPSRCELDLSYRFGPGKSTDKAEKELVGFIGDCAELDILSVAPSCSVPEANPFLERLLSLFPIPQKPKQATTDVAHLKLAGIEGVNFGPGLTSQAHQAKEYALIGELMRSYRIYSDFFKSLSG